MRTDGTIYPVIKLLPENAMPVSVFARERKIAVGQVYMKIKRFEDGKGGKPDYSIRCFMGTNYVIPD